jgi:hypothetical protein
MSQTGPGACALSAQCSAYRRHSRASLLRVNKHGALPGARHPFQKSIPLLDAESSLFQPQRRRYLLQCTRWAWLALLVDTSASAMALTAYHPRPRPARVRLCSFLEIDKGKHGPGGVADAARTGGSQMPMAVEEM